MRNAIAALVALTLLAACAAEPPRSAAADLKRQVAEAERAFARTMADRDHRAFAAFVSEEAVFFTPAAVHGRDAVAAAWKRFYDAPQAPFSREPQEIEVLASGTLAISSGPVRGRDGTLIGTFTSIWRMEAPGVWRVIFDKGTPDAIARSEAADALRCAAHLTRHGPRG